MWIFTDAIVSPFQWTSLICPVGFVVLVFTLASLGRRVDSSETVSHERGRYVISWYEAQRRLALIVKHPLVAPLPPPPPRKLTVMEKLGRAFGRFLLLFMVRSKGGEKILPPVPMTLRWGHLNLPFAESTSHFLIFGAVGSGKTIILRLLMQSILAYIGKGFDHRAVIYDAKRDMVSLLAGMGIDQSRIKLLSPFDARGVAWDLAADITHPADARQLAKMLVPENETTNPFWADAPRHLLSAVVDGLNRVAPRKWTLRDVLLIMRWPARVEWFTAQEPNNASVWPNYSQDEKTLGNLFASIASKLSAYEVVAALYEKASEKISIDQWFQSEGILVLGDNPRFSAALRPINQLIFDRLVDLTLSGSETPTRKTWFFLDELRELEKLNKLHSLLNKGRSKGASVVLGSQDIAGLRTVYGDQGAAEIVGQCNNKTFLRTDSTATAQYVEQHFGQAQSRVYQANYSENWSSGGSGGGTHGGNIAYSQHVKTESAVLASEVMSIPRTGHDHGFRALHDVPLIGAYATWHPFQEILGQLSEPSSEAPNEVPRPVSDQQLQEWTEADMHRLGFPKKLINPGKSDPVKMDEGPVTPPRLSSSSNLNLVTRL